MNTPLPSLLPTSSSLTTRHHHATIPSTEIDSYVVAVVVLMVVY
jgi:hypothetical protein